VKIHDNAKRLAIFANAIQRVQPSGAHLGSRIRTLHLGQVDLYTRDDLTEDILTTIFLHATHLHHITLPLFVTRAYMKLLSRNCRETLRELVMLDCCEGDFIPNFEPSLYYIGGFENLVELLISIRNGPWPDDGWTLPHLKVFLWRLTETSYSPEEEEDNLRFLAQCRFVRLKELCVNVELQSDSWGEYLATLLKNHPFIKTLGLRVELPEVAKLLFALTACEIFIQFGELHPDTILFLPKSTRIVVLDAEHPVQVCQMLDSYLSRSGTITEIHLRTFRRKPFMWHAVHPLPEEANRIAAYLPYSERLWDWGTSLLDDIGQIADVVQPPVSVLAVPF
jgi:hypothetical protein